MSQFRICLSLYGTFDSIASGIRDHPADLFEIRLDLSSDLDLAKVRKLTQKPIIFTSIGKPELLFSAKKYADFLDVGPDRSVRGLEYIVSYHGEKENPETLWQEFQGEHLTKIALETQNYEVIQKLMQLNSQYQPRALCFAMGEVGSFSRILALLQGSPWIYAGLEGKPTAPGQFSFQDLIEIYKLPRFDSIPKVFGIIGNPVAHSKSPAIQNQMFAKENLQWIYLPFLCNDLKALLSRAQHFGIAGFSITHPFKKEVISYLQESSQEVKELEACNTICFHEGRWKGINTDIIGIRHLLRISGINVAGKRVVILGAGGASRAIAAVVGPEAQELTVLNRDPSKAKALASIYGGKAGNLQKFGQLPYDILFQATSIGMKPGESPVDPGSLRAGTTVVDAIYEPAETLLLQKARELGCQTVNGETWFQAQAEAQFDWWRSLLKS